MSTSGITSQELLDAVTGFDELAAEKHMGLDLYTDAERKPIGLMRALIFVHKRHNGTPDKDARIEALEMPMREVNDYFTEDDEASDEDPVTDAGKDEPAPGSGPNDSPDSAY